MFNKRETFYNSIDLLDLALRENLALIHQIQIKARQHNLIFYRQKLFFIDWKYSESQTKRIAFLLMEKHWNSIQLCKTNSICFIIFCPFWQPFVHPSSLRSVRFCVLLHLDYLEYTFFSGNISHFINIFDLKLNVIRTLAAGSPVLLHKSHRMFGANKSRRHVSSHWLWQLVHRNLTLNLVSNSILNETQTILKSLLFTLEV